MKFFAASLLAALAVASPLAVPSDSLDARQFGFGSSTSTDLERGTSANCPKAIFIFARASGEQGNMGGTAGPAVAGTLKSKYSSVWVQGVGGAYTAGIAQNVGQAGTSQGAINEAAKMFNLAQQKCPNTPIVAGGYSQGTAVIAGAIPTLKGNVRDQVKGVVLFGYTKNKQNNGGIPGFPSDRLEVFCNQGDMVCSGTLILMAPHFAYTSVARGEASQFLIKKIGA